MILWYAPPPGYVAPWRDVTPEEARRAAGIALTRADRRTLRILRDGFDLHLALRCVEEARGRGSRDLVLAKLRRSRRERARFLRDARRHPFWTAIRSDYRRWPMDYRQAPAAPRGGTGKQ